MYACQRWVKNFVNFSVKFERMRFLYRMAWTVYLQNVKKNAVELGGTSLNSVEDNVNDDRDKGWKEVLARSSLPSSCGGSERALAYIPDRSKNYGVVARGLPDRFTGSSL